jgi:DNA-binding LacI/PurR family transcriptional regulator
LIGVTPSRAERDQRVRSFDPALDAFRQTLSLHVFACHHLAAERSDEREDELANPGVPVVVAETDENFQPAPPFVERAAAGARLARRRLIRKGRTPPQR